MLGVVGSQGKAYGRATMGSKEDVQVVLGTPPNSDSMKAKLEPVNCDPIPTMPWGDLLSPSVPQGLTESVQQTQSLILAFASC